MSYLDNVCVETCNTCQLSRVGKNDTSFVCAHPPVCYKPVVDPFCRINPWIHCKSVHVVSMPYQLCYAELSMLGTVDWGSEVSAVLLLCVHVGVRVSWRQHVSFPLLTCIVSLQLSSQKSTALTCLPYELRRGGFRPGYPPDYERPRRTLRNYLYWGAEVKQLPNPNFFFPLTFAKLRISLLQDDRNTWRACGCVTLLARPCSPSSHSGCQWSCWGSPPPLCLLPEAEEGRKGLTRGVFWAPATA